MFQDLAFYTAEVKVIESVYFCLLISVVMHAIIQECLLDKASKLLHLSMTMQTGFNEAGQLLAFHLVSLVWGGGIILRENPLNVSTVGVDYPHNNLTFLSNFFIQISYCLNILPELYFQRINSEDRSPEFQSTTTYWIFVTAENGR